MTKKSRLLLAVAAVLPVAVLFLAASPAPSDGPKYTSEGRLMFPEHYREWVFLSSGLGMTYGPLASGEPRFDNVFVNPSAYRSFLETGHWPDKTVFVLEVRQAQSKGSINRGGHFQADVAGVETHVKDEQRFPRKWAFFGFQNGAKASEARAQDDASCYTCHEPKGAVETTFVQFYPTLIPIAKQKGSYQPRE